MPTILKPKQGDDVRTLHNHVRELVKRTNALMNMTVTMQGRISGAGGLEIKKNSAKIKLYTGDPGQLLGGRYLRTTTITIDSSHNPASVGETINFQAVLANDATGTVQFFVDGAAFGAPATVVNGVAISPSAVVGSGAFRQGNHVVQANYGGSFLYLPVSASLLQVVEGLNKPTVNAFGNPNPASNGDHIFLGANVTGQNPIPPAPNITGSVRFFVNGSPVGDYPLTLLSAGTWRAVTGNLADRFGVGNTPVQALYLGDNNYGTASGDYIQTVTATTTVILTIDPNPAETNSATTLTATISGGGGSPTGTVQFTDEHGNIGGPVPVVNGAASMGIGTGGTETTYHFVAHYSGDAFNGPAVSDTVELIIGPTEVDLDIYILDYPGYHGFGPLYPASAYHTDNQHVTYYVVYTTSIGIRILGLPVLQIYDNGSLVFVGSPNIVAANAVISGSSIVLSGPSSPLFIPMQWAWPGMVIDGTHNYQNNMIGGTPLRFEFFSPSTGGTLQAHQIWDDSTVDDWSTTLIF